LTKTAKQFHLFNDAEAAVQAICSLATRVICRKPVASNSLARFKAPASNTRKGLSLDGHLRFLVIASQKNRGWQVANFSALQSCGKSRVEALDYLGVR
jgi:hypothetical protein